MLSRLILMQYDSKEREYDLRAYVSHHMDYHIYSKTLDS